MRPFVLLVAFYLCVPCLCFAQVGIDVVYEVEATGETDPVPSEDDAADDACFWIHPADASLSLIIVADKDYGLQVCDLDGAELQFLPDAEFNNVDIRYNFPLDGEYVDLVCASDRTFESIQMYRVDAATRQLVNVTGTPVETGETSYGCALYRSPTTATFYVLLTVLDLDEFQQWELSDNGDGGVDATLVRTIDLPDQGEGLVGDDELGFIYLAIENDEIRRYCGEPEDGDDYEVVDTTDASGHVVNDIEGLSIYYTGDGTGYLLASSQGADEFVVYDRVGDNDYLATFTIVDSGVIGACEETDGIDVTNVNLGDAFPEGVFIAQDGINDPFTQNCKLVPWDVIAEAVDPPLTIDTSFDPRMVGGDATAPEAPTDVTGQPTDRGIAFRWRRSVEPDSSIALYEVLRDGEHLMYAGGTSIIDESAIADEEYSYAVRAYNASGVEGALSSSVDVTAIADGIPPRLIDLRVGDGLRSLCLQFDESLDLDTATFEIENTDDALDVTIDSALLAGDGQKIVIECEDLVEGTNYSLDVTGLTDLAGNELSEMLVDWSFSLVDEVRDIRVQRWLDDAEETFDGAVGLESGDLELGTNGGDERTVGIRYRDFPVGRRATVSIADIQFQVDEDDDAPGSLLLEGELASDAAPFVEVNGNLTDRDRTVASVTWSPPTWDVLGEAGVDQLTPDLAEIIEEITSQDDWQAGNALVFFVTGLAERVAESFEGGADVAPLLHLEYTRPETSFSIPESFRRGDINLDGAVNIVDPIVSLDALFLGIYELPCDDSADVDDDGTLALDDIVTLLSHLFSGGFPPPPPFTVCGTDFTDDTLGCDAEDCL